VGEDAKNLQQSKFAGVEGWDNIEVDVQVGSVVQGTWDGAGTAGEEAVRSSLIQCSSCCSERRRCYRRKIVQRSDLSRPSREWKYCQRGSENLKAVDFCGARLFEDDLPHWEKSVGGTLRKEGRPLDSPGSGDLL
jgi:hypothetical protein